MPIHGKKTWEALLASRGSAEEYAGYLWEEAGIPARFRDLRLATHPLLARPMASELQRMVANARSAPDFWRQSWYLWGGVGVGKTGLAVGYAHQWVDPSFGDPMSVVYYVVPDLLARLRASYNATGSTEASESEWSLIDRCRQADLLLLDDLGAEQVARTGWIEDRLLLVVGWRHDEGLPTVYTSNLSPRELVQQLGERIVWRIVESCGEGNVVHVEGPNLRAHWTQNRGEAT